MEFGPTAVTQNERAPEPLSTPDYSRVFVTREAGAGIDRIVQTQVTLEEVLVGLADDDERLSRAITALIRDRPTQY